MKLSYISIFNLVLALSACSSDNNVDDIKIEDTSNAASSNIVRSVAIVPGKQCAAGGVEVTSGIDSNGNKKLEASEIIETQIVCHGETGYDSIIAIKDVPSGSNCENSGKSISVGKDTNRNNILDDSETSEVQYVCNGKDGNNSTAEGISCSIKEDVNGSKILECADGSIIPVTDGIMIVSPTTNPIDGGIQIVDSWESSAGRNRYSLRNRHYLFEVTKGGEISISIESGVSNYLYLIDDLGFIVSEVSGNTINPTIDVGKYKLIAATYYADQNSNYLINIVGDVSNIAKVASNKQEVVSNWQSSGGQIKESYRNRHYDIVFSQDSYIDIGITSTVSNYIYLINSLGFLVKEVSGNRLFSAVPADTYRIVIATYYPSAESNFVMDVVGQFDSDTFQEKTSVLFSETSAWVLSGGPDRFSPKNPVYSFDVTEDSLVDITITSSVSNYLYLVDSLGLVVKEVSGNRLTKFVSTGSYTLVVATYYVDQSSNYVLKLSGQIDNLLLK